MWYGWKWTDAERELRRAIGLSPSHSDSHSELAGLLSILGRAEEAIAAGRHAVRLDPLSPFAHMKLAEALTFSQQYDAAIEVSRRSVELAPAAVIAYYYLGNASLWKGDAQQAVREFERGRVYSQGEPTLEGRLGCAYGKAGRPEEARQIADALRRRREERYLSAHAVAWVYAGLWGTTTPRSSGSPRALTTTIRSLRSSRFSQITTRCAPTRGFRSSSSGYLGRHAKAG